MVRDLPQCSSNWSQQGKGNFFLSLLLSYEDVIPEFLALIIYFPVAMGKSLFAVAEVEAKQRSAKTRDGLRKSDRAEREHFGGIRLPVPISGLLGVARVPVALLS